MPRSSTTDEARLAWLLLAPAVGSVVVVALLPLAWAVRESFHLHDLRAPWLGQPWIGLANYAEAVGDARLWQALAHTAGFAASSVALELALGLLLALALHRTFAARGPVRTLALIPWALPTVVAATMWSLLLNDRVGLVNSVLERLGLMQEPIVWLGPRLAMFSVIAADVWKTTPFVAIILLAGLKSIPYQYYEAAALDGAGRWAVFRSITLPLLKPFIAVAVLFRTMDAFRVFDLIWVLTGGASRTETLSVYIHKVLFRYADLGYGSTITVALFAIVFALSLALIICIGKVILK